MPLSRLLALTTLGLALIAGCAPAAPPAPASPASAPPASAAPEVGPPDVPGLAVYRVADEPRAAVVRLQRALDRAGAVVATVDHAADAARAGQRLRPTTLVVGGAPRAGTPIQQGAPVAGVDLPARFLVWRDEDGATWLGHNTAAYVAARAGTSGSTPEVERLAGTLAAVARSASGSAAPVRPGDDVDTVSTEDYLRTTLTPRPVGEVVAAVRRAAAREGMRVLAAVDHARAAAATRTPLAPSTLVLVGDPSGGAQLLADRQTVGIDLPMRFLAWSDGTVTRLSHPDPAALAARHGLRGQTGALEEMARTADELAGHARP